MRHRSSLFELRLCRHLRQSSLQIDTARFPGGTAGVIEALSTDGDVTWERCDVTRVLTLSWRVNRGLDSRTAAAVLGLGLGHRREVPRRAARFCPVVQPGTM